MFKLKKAKKYISEFGQLIILIVSIPFLLILILPYSRLRYVVKKLFKIKPSILWGPAPIISNYHNSLAVKKYGYKSDTLVYQPYIITQSKIFDYNLSRFRKIPILSFTIPFLVIFWAALKYDILHFYYNGGFLLNSNLLFIKFEHILWKILGKKVILSAYGSDVRLESITRKLGKYNAYMDMTHEDVLKEAHLTEKQIKKRIDIVIKYSSAHISMGDMIEYTPGSINNIFYWAMDTDQWKPVYETNNDKIIILHAPNHKHYKGTRFLLPIIERLKNEGYPIEFVLIQGMTNAEARQFYEKADIIAEQFIIGWHGFFAIEAMALGKPVLCYIRKKEYLPSWASCPIVNTNPDNLYDNLKKLVENQQYRQEIGRQGRRYVEKVYSLEKVGGRLDKLYKSIC
ncbi:MAG: hypothetical protein Q8P20_02705 [bacterium]|nr:hypothetical protein [bacterium]